MTNQGRHSSEITFQEEINDTKGMSLHFNAGQDNVANKNSRNNMGCRRARAYSFVGCLDHLTIDHAAFSRRSTGAGRGRGMLEDK